MPPEAKDFINTLPEWMQGTATIGFLLASVLVAILGFARNMKSEPKAASKEVVVETPKGDPGKVQQTVEAVAVEYMLLHDINETLKDGFKALEDRQESETEKVCALMKEAIRLMAQELSEKNVEREVLKRLGHALPPGYPQQPAPYPPNSR